MSVRIEVDENSLSSVEPWPIIEPVWWSVNIYDGPDAYEASLRPFSRPQRLVHAMLWYDAEVCNGGHHQFYSNSTGVVWPNALAGFEAAGMLTIASILRESADRLGGRPSLVKSERNRQLEVTAVDFGDLDDRYYAYNRAQDFDASIMKYIRESPAEFYFSGFVEKPTQRSN